MLIKSEEAERLSRILCFCPPQRTSVILTILLILKNINILSSELFHNIIICQQSLVLILFNPFVM